MAVYYRGAIATITHEAIIVPRVEPQMFLISDLSGIQAICVGSGSVVTRHRLLGASALVGVFFAMPVLGQASVILAVTTGMASIVYAGVCLRIRPELRYQLVAFAGRDLVTLVETDDRVEFDQVTRGLRRAMEVQGMW